MTITLDRGPQDVGDMLQQLNVIRRQINALNITPPSTPGENPPGSQANGGFTVTVNSDGFGEVDFWNLKNATADGQGFYFNQKINENSSAIVAAIYSPTNTAEFDLIDPTNVSTLVLLSTTGHNSIAATGTGLAVGYGPGFAFGDIPSAVAVLGTVILITNSDTQTWGATIGAASPGNPVLAFYNGSNWTVIGK